MVDEIIQKEEVVVEAPIEPVSEPTQALEAPTDQTPVSEPLTAPTAPTEPEAEPAVETIPAETKLVETTPEELPPSVPLHEEKPLASSESEITEPIQTESKPVDTSLASSAPSASQPTAISETKPEPKQESITEHEQPKVISVIIPSKSLARELLVKARNMIQFRKRKKLDKIMTLFLKKQKITNDEVEKFMHVSDATATRYLNTLEKENKFKQSGKTGKSVFYSKI